MSLRPRAGPRRRLRRLAISVFVVFNLTAIAAWIWPKSTISNPMVRIAAPYLRFLSMDQSWPMFAWPRTFNMHVSAVAAFADGTTAETRLPWEPRAGFWERYRKVRTWMKFAEAVGMYGAYPNPALWESYARYVARLHAARRPISVTLVCHWSDIPPPPEGYGRPVPEETNRRPYYTYRVTDEDLK